jgi:hypothetical protein
MATILSVYVDPLSEDAGSKFGISDESQVPSPSISSVTSSSLPLDSFFVLLT